jgi:hypothetical protein
VGAFSTCSAGNWPEARGFWPEQNVDECALFGPTSGIHKALEGKGRSTPSSRLKCPRLIRLLVLGQIPAQKARPTVPGPACVPTTGLAAAM